MLAGSSSSTQRDCGPRWLSWALAGACVGLWGVKFWLAFRLNINWDEFLYLSQVHAAVRGEVNHAWQTSYTYLFAWLPGMAGDEIDHIHAARMLTVFLLGVSAVLIQRLACRWLPAPFAWVAAMAFLAMWPTMKHGGSFRADSLLLPLQLSALLLLTHPGLGNRDRGIAAGAVLGLAAAVTVKVILLTPVVLAFVAGDSRDWRSGFQRLAWLALAAMITAIVLVGAHMLSIRAQDGLAAAGVAAGHAWQKTLQDAPWFPQASTMREMLREDFVFWMVAAGGAVWALWRRRWVVAACGLALSPIAFYRNSYAYYYVVMWAPASILVATAIAAAHCAMTRMARPALAAMVAVSLAVLLFAQGLRDIPYLSHPRQAEQRQLIAAVHSIFPDPVPYIDHSGMIASFRKVNFFMSNWGVERYLARGRPFMPSAIEQFQPPMLIMNRAELVPGTGSFARLLPEDRRIIETQYLRYWGPIRIAGASGIVGAEQSAVLELPFGGEYRLASPSSVVIDGKTIAPGDVIEVPRANPIVTVNSGVVTAPDVWQEVRLVWAAAQPAPARPPVSSAYYDSL